MRTIVGDEVGRQVAPTCRHRVLVIDRYVFGRRTLCTCIAELGHLAIEADDDNDARAIVASTTIDLIIINCDEPGSQSLLAELHGINPATPAVVMSINHERWPTLPDNALLLVQSLGLDLLEKLIDARSLHRTVAAQSSRDRV